MEMPKASEIKFIFVCGSGVGCGGCGDSREHKKSTLNSFFICIFSLSMNSTNFSKAPVKSMMAIFHDENPTQKKSL